MSAAARLLEVSRSARLMPRIGSVTQVAGLAVEARGPDARIGEICHVQPRDASAAVACEVVALRPGAVILMPYGSAHGLASGDAVVASGECASIGVGPGLLGRVIDAFGQALDGAPEPVCERRVSLEAQASNPMQRPRIGTALHTGVRAIDCLLTLGRGQRVGIFAGSGVGKSSLLGMIARHVEADLNVIALIGERGREVRDFIEGQLGEAGLKRSVVVVATADQPALARVRAAYAAVALAEHFRGQGRQVLLTMDSITRLAMARREIALSAGEPPTARGYTPSVFAELPALCERCGTAPSGGSISALLTVLVEGDDLNEPIADTLRATLDGHLVLSRKLAQQGHYPPIDVAASASRVMRELLDERQRALARAATVALALLERYRAMVDMGAYVRGSQPALDRALEAEAALGQFLRQGDGGIPPAAAWTALERIFPEALT